MDDIEPRHKFHQLVRTKIDLKLVSAIYEIASVVVKILDYFEQDNQRTISEVIPTYEFLFRYCCSETPDSETRDYMIALKRAMLCTVSEQLFQRYSDINGTIIENRMVPKRIGESEKLSYFLSWNTSTCKLSRAVSDLKASRDPQFVKTAEIIESETVDMYSDVTSFGYDNWKNHVQGTIDRIGKNLGFTSDDVDLAKELQPVQIDDEDDNFIDPDLLEELSPAQPSSRQSDLTVELSSYTDRRSFNQKDWSSCK